MTTDVKNAAEPSAAAPATPEAPQFNPSDQNTWSPEQREHWNKTGDVPEQPKKEQEAAPATSSDKSDSGPKGKSAAEAETAQQQEKKARKPGEKISAEERIAQLKRENKELEERLRGRESATQPTSKTEPAKAEAKVEPPKRPNPFTFKGTPEEFEAAQEKWESHLKSQAAQEFQRKQQEAAAAEQMKAQIEDAKTRYSDFETVIAPAVEQLLGQANDIPVVVQQAVNRTPHLTDVMYVLGGDQKALNDFIATAKADPIAAIQKLFFLEQEVSKELGKGKAAKSGEAEAGAGDEKKETPVETKPRAPKPPSEVGGRGTTSEDALVAAARANNFSDFEKEQTRRLLTRH